MSRKLSLLFKISQRRISLNSPCTSSSSFFTDYALSNKIIKSSLPELDFHCHSFIESLNKDLRKLHFIERKIYSIRNDIKKCFNNPDIRFVPIGSAANCLLNNSSDLDLVLLPSKDVGQWKNFMSRFEGNEQFRRSYLSRTYDQLVSGKIGIINQPFFNAKIPIIRMYSKRRLQVDIQFGNIGPIRSSLFIRTCVEYDERVGLLIHWLTNKFQESGILKNRFFSRYHVNALVIHFLQAIPYPVLPDIIELSPWLSTKNDWSNAVNVLTRQGSLYVPNCNEIPNEQSVGGLAVQLIDYFSQIDFKNFSIDTRGNVFQKSDNDPLYFKISDEYFDQPTCNVMEAPRLLSEFFSELKTKAEAGDYRDLFNYHVQIKKTKS